MLLRLGKFGVYCMGAVFLGSYLWSGGEDVQVRVQPEVTAITPPANAVIPGVDGRQHTPPQPVAEQPVVQPEQGQQPTGPVRIDPDLTNLQVTVLNTCFEQNARRMARVNGDEAFRQAAMDGMRLLARDGAVQNADATAFTCIDFANAVANNFGNLQEGYCRTANIRLHHYTPARTVSIPLCRSPEGGRLVVGEQGVTLRR